MICFSYQRVEITAAKKKTLATKKAVDAPASMPGGKQPICQLKVGGNYVYSKAGQANSVSVSPVQLFTPDVTNGYDQGIGVYYIDNTQSFVSTYFVLSTDGKTALLPYKTALGAWTLSQVNSIGFYSLSNNFSGTDKSTKKIELIFDSNWWGMDNLNALLAQANSRRTAASAASAAAKATFLTACNSFMSDNPAYLAASATGASQASQIAALTANMNTLNATTATVQTNLNTADATLAGLQQQVVAAQAARDALANNLSSIASQVAQTNAQIATLQSGAISAAAIAALQAAVASDTTALTNAAANLKTIFTASGAKVDSAVADCQAAKQSAIAADITAIV